MPSGIGWEEWLDQKAVPGKKLEVSQKVKDVFKIFELVDERPEIILFGTGRRVLPPPGPVRQWLNELGIQLDVQSTVSRPLVAHFHIDERHFVLTRNVALPPWVNSTMQHRRTTCSPKKVAKWPPF